MGKGPSTSLVSDFFGSYVPYNGARPDRRVMPLGDSLTDGYTTPGGYRINLYTLLKSALVEFDFVGSLQNGPASLPDTDYEGFPSKRIDEVQALAAADIVTYQPQAVLLLAGTNDVSQNYLLTTAGERLIAFIDLIHASVPQTTTYLSTIPPIGDPVQNARVPAFNAQLPGVVDTERRKGNSVYFVDAGGTLTLADLYDTFHPTAAGYDKMSYAWAQALVGRPF